MATAVAAPPVGMSVVEMNRLWDKGSKAQRAAILANFLKRHRGSTAAEIERDLGHGALLFFTRITAWLRLTYQVGTSLSLQLAALSLFLQGQRYLTQFMEIGGIQTLTDLVSMCDERSISKEDKTNAIILLIHIANSGRVYREMVCDDKGIGLLVKAALSEDSDRVLELLGSLFLALGQGNPRKASVVHGGLLTLMRRGNDGAALCAATTLRSLQLAKQSYGGPGQGVIGTEPGSEESASTLLDSFFHLLRSNSVKLRFEGMELLTIAAQNAALLGPTIRRCLETLEHREVAFDADDAVAQPLKRQQSSCGRILCSVIQSPLTHDNAVHVLALFDRYSAHLTLGKYLRQCEGTDIPGMVECTKSLRRLARGAYASAAGSETSEEAVRTTSEWLVAAIGRPLYDRLLGSADVTEALAAEVAAALSAVEVEAQRVVDHELGDAATAFVAA